MKWFLFTGLDVCEQFMDVNDMIKDEDLIVHKLNPHGNGLDRRFYTSASARNIQRLVSSMVPSVISKRPSARELNMLKRKAKINSKDQSKGWSEDVDMEVSYAHNVTTPKGSRGDPFGSIKVYIFFFFHCFLIDRVHLSICLFILTPRFICVLTFYVCTCMHVYA